MPRAPARGRPAALNLSFQILDLQVTIASEVETVAALRQSAHHAFPPTRSVEYAVRKSDAGFDITEDGTLLASVPYPIDVFMALDRHVYRAALAPYADATLLMAACVRIGGTRLLLVGDRDVDRTALLLSLLQRGAVVEGDWCVLLDGDRVTTVARTLRLTEDVADAELVAGQPFVQDALGRKTWSFDPTTKGFPWEIRNDDIDVIVVVESNPGGRSRLERRPRHETAQEVVAAIYAVTGARIAAACRLVDACACRRLRLGDADEAASLLGGIEGTSGSE